VSKQLLRKSKLTFTLPSLQISITYRGAIKDFVDGNQITKLTTQKITDQFGNLVSDGTLVAFYITTVNMVLKPMPLLLTESL
jgi:hypothetical protein